MPENCAFINCPHSRRYEGLSLFKIPTVKSSDSEHTSRIKSEARDAWKTVILRTRQLTKELKERFEKNNIFLCEHHFEAEFVDTFPFTDKDGNEKVRKRLQTGAVPTLNLPVKQLDTLPGSSTPQQRRSVIRHDEQPTSSGTFQPPTFDDLKKYFKRNYQYLRDWTVNVTDDVIVVELREPGFLIPKYHLQIDESLELTVAIYGATVPNSSALFPEGKSRLCGKFKDLHNLLCDLRICCGVSVMENETSSSETFLHVTPLIASKQQSSPVNYSQTRRSNKCEILVDQGIEKCKPCCKVDDKKAQPKPALPAKSKAPLTACSSAKLQATVREERVKLKESELKCMQLEDRLNRMEKEINSHGVTLDDDVSNSFLAILDQTNLQASPHMKLVFQQQQKAMRTNKHGQRWHPHFIEFCLSIHAKSSSVYNELRKSEKNPDGILYLPHERTLRDYRNHFKPGVGFVLENIELLKSMTKEYKGSARYVVLVFDEMKIKGRLVFDKHSGKLIGFTSLGDPDLDFSTFDELEVATHVLAFMVRGVQTTLKFMLVYFLTQTVVSYQLAPIFWRAVAILELNCQLYVVAATSDGMSANRKFFRLHKHISGKDAEEKLPVCYKTVNLFAPQRTIWFFADVPHLMKTTRGMIHFKWSITCISNIDIANLQMYLVHPFFTHCIISKVIVKVYGVQTFAFCCLLFDHR